MNAIPDYIEARSPKGAKSVKQRLQGVKPRAAIHTPDNARKQAAP